MLVGIAPICLRSKYSPSVLVSDVPSFGEEFRSRNGSVSDPSEALRDMVALSPFVLSHCRLSLPLHLHLVLLLRLCIIFYQKCCRLRIITLYSKRVIIPPNLYLRKSEMCSRNVGWRRRFREWIIPNCGHLRWKC